MFGTGFLTKRACADDVSASPEPSHHLNLNPSDLLSQKAGSNYANMSIEDLLKVVVTTVRRQPQRIADSAAPVTVITAEDIHRLQY